MNFDCKVNIVDMIMGAGKTSAAINYINAMPEDEKVMFITPYESERDRIIEGCKDKNLKEPQRMGTKLRGIKYLIEKGLNIASTHALFHRFDEETIDMCRTQNYTLIMDEVTNVVEKYNITKEDFETLKREYITIEEGSGRIRWREDKMNYDDQYGKFRDEKRLCELGCLAYYSGNIMMWLFPIEAFNAFKKIYILTYMFDSQIQRYYYDYYRLSYSYLYIKGDSIENYVFSNEKPETKYKYNFRELIHVIDNEKLNSIGEREFDLAKNWYRRNQNNIVMKQLRNNITNFFKNIRKSASSENMWTTFVDYKKNLSNKGYSKGFLEVNARGTNRFRERINVAYPVNRYLNTGVKNFFLLHEIDVNEDGFALSEMLQFIWRSAIRDGKEIWIYIPSIRMRNLLTDWIEENSPK